MTPQTALTPLEIYKHLPQTNCGKCLFPSCLAFAAAVAAGSRRPDECPEMNDQNLIFFARHFEPPEKNREAAQAEFIQRLKEKIAGIDFFHIAPELGAKFDGSHLVINSLGKDFRVDNQGNLASECHIIPWVLAPLLSYITNPTHAKPDGRWISFREIKGGIDWQGLFTSRCEMPMKKLADDNPALLTDLIDIFNGQAVEWYEADIALVLNPLPHFPILICYQAPEDDLDSVLTIFFDHCCGSNLDIKPLFTLCSGLVQMFSKVAAHHQ